MEKNASLETTKRNIEDELERVCYLKQIISQVNFPILIIWIISSPEPKAHR